VIVRSRPSGPESIPGPPEYETVVPTRGTKMRAKRKSGEVFRVDRMTNTLDTPVLAAAS